MKANTLYLIILSTRRFSYAIGFTLFPIYLLRIVETNPLGLILPGVVYELATFLFEIPTGIVADVYSRRLSIIIGYFLLGIGLITAGLYPVLPIIAMGLGVMGIGSTFVSGALSAWLVDEVGQEQASQTFLRGSQTSILANLAGIGLCMFLSSVNLQLAVVGAGMPLLVLALVLCFVMPETGFQPLPTEQRASQSMFTTFGRGLQFVRQSHILRWILVVIFVLAGFGETFGKLWQAHILENFSLPALANFDDILWFGLISAVSIPASLVATEFIRRRVDLNNSQTVVRSLMLLFVCLCASTLLFVLSHRFAAMLCGIWLVHIAKAMIKPLLDIWLNQHIASPTRATVLSIVGQVNALGEVIVGGPIAGGLATLLSVRLTIAVVALSLLPLTLLFRLVSARPSSHGVTTFVSEQTQRDG